MIITQVKINILKLLRNRGKCPFYRRTLYTSQSHRGNSSESRYTTECAVGWSESGGKSAIYCIRAYLFRTPLDFIGHSEMGENLFAARRRFGSHSQAQSLRTVSRPQNGSDLGLAEARLLQFGEDEVILRGLEGAHVIPVKLAEKVFVVPFSLVLGVFQHRG